MTEIELARIDGGTVALHDARRNVRWTVELEPFEIGVYPVTEAQLGELLGEAANHPLREVVELQGGTFDGIRHVEGWVPQRLVTATGPNPLPR